MRGRGYVECLTMPEALDRVPIEAPRATPRGWTYSFLLPTWLSKATAGILGARRGRGIWRLGGIGHRSSPVGVSLGPPGGTAAACFRASLLACLRSRRSRTAFSRLSFAIVVFFFELEAMHSVPSMEFRARR